MEKRYLFKKVLPGITLLISAAAMAQPYKKAAAPPARPPAPALAFIENKGQWNREARFKADLPGGALFLTDKGFVYNFASASDLHRIHEKYEQENGPVDKELVSYHAYKVNFEGANTDVGYETAQKRSYYCNYITGSDVSAWVGHADVYGQVKQTQVYPGIDVAVAARQSSVKYDFLVAAGADPSRIRLSFNGVQPSLTANGDLKIVTSVNEIIEKAPYSYQLINGVKVAVKTRYQLEKGILSFAFPQGYDKAYDLVVDPELVFATYSGGSSASNYSYATTYDATGHLYAGAQAYGTGWPVTPGAFQLTFAASQDVAINKYSPDGVSLIYSTYYGGSAVDLPHAMMVNEQDELIIAGTTTSSDLPVTAGCYDATYNNARDIFIAHFNSAGSALVGATYIGSQSVAEPNTFTLTGTSTAVTSQNLTSPLELNIDATGNIWVVGNTPSSTFPVTSNALQGTSGGGMDALLFKMSPDCASLLYSTYLGGSGNDAGFGIKFQSNGNIVICGATQSNNFPTTAGALHPTAPGGTFDGFVSIISPAGALLQSTYLGTTGTDQAVNLDVDCADNIYILGRTNGDYPVSPNVYSLPGADIFIDKLSPNLSASLLSTRLGYPISGISKCFPTGFVLDICGNVYVSTLTSSGSSSYVVPGMPLTPDAFSTTPDNFYFIALEAGFNDLLFATYFGLPNVDDHTHVGVNRMDKQGIVYQSICCAGTGWPTAPANVYAPNKANSSGQDIISFKFNFDAINIDLATQSTQGGMDTAAHCVRGCKSAFVDFSRLGQLDSPMVVHYLISGTAVNGTDYQQIPDSIIIPANMTDATLEIKPLLVASPTGVREVIIEALSPCGCEDGTNNVVKVAKVKIYDSLYVRMLTPFDTVCPNTPITFEAEIDSTLHYTWMPAAYDQDTLVIQTTAYSTSRYYITVSQPGAPATCPPRTAMYEVFVEPIPQLTFPERNFNVCEQGDSIDILAYVGPPGTNYNYLWTPASYLRDDHSLVNKFYAPLGDYTRRLTVSTPVAHCTSEDSITLHVMPPFSFRSIYPASDTTIRYGDTIRLNTESDAIYWIWSPITYLDDPLAKSPLARPLETTLYEVVGLDANGCRDTAKVLVNVEYGSNAGVPNAFSPNGDGVNDVFKIANLKFEKMSEFRVFNRYGQNVYEGRNPEEGWDGTFKGSPAPIDTYYYFIRLHFPDGTDKVLKGDVILLR